MKDYRESNGFRTVKAVGDDETPKTLEAFYDPVEIDNPPLIDIPVEIDNPPLIDHSVEIDRTRRTIEH